MKKTNESDWLQRKVLMEAKNRAKLINKINIDPFFPLTLDPPLLGASLDIQTRDSLEFLLVEFAPYFSAAIHSEQKGLIDREVGAAINQLVAAVCSRTRTNSMFFESAGNIAKESAHAVLDEIPNDLQRARKHRDLFENWPDMPPTYKDALKGKTSTVRRISARYNNSFSVFLRSWMEQLWSLHAGITAVGPNRARFAVLVQNSPWTLDEIRSLKDLSPEKWIETIVSGMKKKIPDPTRHAVLKERGVRPSRIWSTVTTGIRDRFDRFLEEKCGTTSAQTLSSQDCGSSGKA